MTPWEWLDQVLIHKKPWDSFSEKEQKTFSPYMIHRFLSMNQNYTELVNDFQKYYTLEPKQVYEFYKEVIPKKRSFDKYIKAKKEETYPEWVIEILCEYFKESKNHIIEYLYLMEKSELRTILEMYGTDSKQIKKLKLEK